MWLDNVSQRLVDDFWAKCMEADSFPRNLERPLALALPVALVKLPKLQLREIETWLRRRGANFQFNCQSRAVRGCLVAFRGSGVIFLDSTDPDKEQRFTLAHEIAHFMVDYWRPRQAVLNQLGEHMAEVVDGIRPPTLNERVLALLSGVSTGVHTDLMERDQQLNDLTGTVWSIENRADRIALALLAPPGVVLNNVNLSATQYDQRDQTLIDVLCDDFGLPTSVAKSYSHALLTASGKGRSWLESVGLR